MASKSDRQATEGSPKSRRSCERLRGSVLRDGRGCKSLEDRLRMFEAFFRHTITPLAFLDRSFNFIRVNQAYAKVDGKTPEDFVGRNPFTLFPDPQMQEIFQQVVRTGRPYRASNSPLAYPDGSSHMRYWIWQLTPLLDDAGNPEFLVLSLEDVTSQQRTVRELRHRAGQLQKLAMELSQAEDRERRRLAEVLHDDLQQVLAAAKFHLGICHSHLQSDDELHGLLSQVGDLLREAIEKSRSLSHELSPMVLYQSDLGETFEWLARQVQAKHGLNVRVEVRGRIEPQSEALRAFLYRAARELLFNVVKHAGTDEACLRLRCVRGRIRLTIADRGRGFDSKVTHAAEGFGLMSIRERVEMLGGRMRIRSRPGRGCILLLWVPDRPMSGTSYAPPATCL
ncbi:MAG TPA: PAS domain-containing protein [Sedimentisphaerales bacterium]|nr:PAS domain-containing protein [Phycisphaerae bacterium]HQI28460.1 PAS domain-containing protein [Sedimentisphaerales bacterium]